ncbi:MAG: hypothetical protein JWN66_3266 [Sphingomonas bacterium]|uniref:hypothetical protein n=1 Tax=Sphingomonas bacterium TaxID=1895847 RepID=UPI00260B40EB|nr:hypothetical protein [Sphingomonas bacterium]MDB5706150.1 hypothetical protein [Sphingomonas bacterium]
MTGQNYPPLSMLLSPEKISGNLSFVGDAVDQILKGVRYTQLVVETSPANDSKYYSLTLVTAELAIDVLGSGVRLILFPAEDTSSEDEDGDTDNAPPVSEIPVAFGYRWPILRFVRGFDALSFAGGARAFFDLALTLAEVTPEEFIAGVVECFIDDPQPYQALYDALAGWDAGGGATPLSGLQLADVPVGDTPLQYVAARVVALGVDLDRAAFELFVDTSDIDTAIDNVLALFRNWLGGINRSDLERLLLPQFAVELREITAAIEVPRTVLIPLDDDGEPSDNKVWRAEFTAGAIRYDSESGFDIAVDDGVGIDLPPAIFPGLGITIALQDGKLDLSRDSNIAEADADGRPPDFIGLSARTAVLGLPQEWFGDLSGGSSTLAIVGRNMLFGTGGVSGKVALEVLDLATLAPAAEAMPADGTQELEFVLGKAPETGARKGFAIGFSTFEMTFRQNVLLDTRIVGSLTVPRFNPGKIGIELRIAQDGDFAVTGTFGDEGHPFEVPGIFTYTAMKIAVGKEDGQVFLQTSGDLAFDGLLGSLIPDPIHIEKLTIDSAGGFSIAGGSIPLPQSVVLPLGPVKLAITAIHIGKTTQPHEGVPRNYSYFGLDGGIDTNPTGVNCRGKGVKYYYTTDDNPSLGRLSHKFLRIEELKVDIVLPFGASNEDAVLMIHGFLALKDPVYQGLIGFELPKASIAGGAAMQYHTQRPAWLVQAWLELPVGLPLGSTSLAIYGFKAMFGLRFIASKLAVPGLTEDDSWTDFYAAPPLGLSYEKFLSPEKTEGASNPFSIGAGVSLATQANEGKTFTSQLFLMIQMPFLLVLEGKFDVMADQRLGLTGDEPPFYAVLILSATSIEIGAGAHYLLPRATGEILTLDATMEAAYFFRNSSAWYLNVGTEEKPVTARVISMFDAHAFLMLSASGISAGTGVSYDFTKNYGPIHVSAYAYLDMWAHVSFTRGRAGGGIALGGHLEVSVFKLGLQVSLATVLTVELAKPFRIAGSVEVCVSVDLKIKKFEKCVNVDFVWQRSNEIDRDPVPLIAGGAGGEPASAVHMLSGDTYKLEFSTSPDPQQTCFVPIDSYIDIKLAKPVVPGAGTGNIGGFTSAPQGTSERLPPRFAAHAVDHDYALDSVRLEVLGPNGWIDYHPYQAIAGLPDGNTVPDLTSLPIGMWQRQEAGHTDIRLLALTPFSFMRPAIAYRPEEWGVTPSSIYCVGTAREERCAIWDRPDLNVGIGQGGEINGMTFLAEAQSAGVVALTDPRLAPYSLALQPGGRLVLTFHEPVASCRIVAHSQANAVTVRFQRRKQVTLDESPSPIPAPWPSANVEYVDQEVRQVARADLANPIVYAASPSSIERVVIETPAPDQALIDQLELQLAQLYDAWVLAALKDRPTVDAQRQKLRAQIRVEHDRICVADAGWGPGADNAQAQDAARQRLERLLTVLAGKRAQYDRDCGTMPGASVPGTPNPVAASGARPPVLRASAEPVRETPVVRDAEPAPPRGCLAVFFPAPTPTPPSPTPTPTPTPSPPPPPAPPPPPSVDCAALAKEIALLEEQVAALQAEIDALASQPYYHPPRDWECGTFVHEVCWMTSKDLAYNLSTPGLDAIEADFSTMRDAIRTRVAPVWRPHQAYRVTLLVSDTVTPAGESALIHHQPYYVHFSTDGPIGFYSKYQPPALFGIPPDLPPNPVPPPDGDDRDETPVLALKYYIDARSFPDPSGRLDYAKPLYWGKVALNLYLSAPHAYHFFIDWPADIGLDPRQYAMEIRVLDPAMAQLDPNALPHEAPDVSSPSIAPVTWIDDEAPRVTPEIAALNAYHGSPGLGAGDVCLVSGGEPIVPAARAAHVELSDLKPNKLYTAVVFNQRLDGSGAEAEIHRFPFCTSRYPDFAAHIASSRLRDAKGNSRMAVFAIDAPLAAGARAAALATIDMVNPAAEPDTDAYPDAFDRLIFARLGLAVPAPPAGIEYNFVSDGAGDTYGLWLRGIEAINDPRMPRAEAAAAIALLANDDPVDPDSLGILVSRDGREIFVMARGGSLAIVDVAVSFTPRNWDGDSYVAGTAVTSDAFSKP